MSVLHLAVLINVLLIRCRITLEIMTLQPRCEDVETAEGVAITVTGVAQVKAGPRRLSGGRHTSAAPKKEVVALLTPYVTTEFLIHINTQAELTCV